MVKHRLVVAMVASTLSAAIVVAPAFGAPDASGRAARTTIARSIDHIGGFTPALADPRLAAMVGKPNLGARDYRFTPAEARRPTVLAAPALAVRTKAEALVAESVPGASIKVAPIAYSLGVSVGWKKFGAGADVPRPEPTIATRSSFDLAATTPAATRPTNRLRLNVDQPAVGAALPGTESVQPMLDSTNAFRLTRNVDLTAGTRLKTEDYRLDRLGNDRRDRQAVYIGTALRF